MKNLRTILSYFIALAALAYLPLTGYSQYKDFVVKESKKEFFAISFDKQSISIIVFDSADSKRADANLGDIVISENEVKISPSVSFRPEGLSFDEMTFSYEQIVESRITVENESKTITFYTQSGPSTRISKMREGNILTFADAIQIKQGDFVRGMVFSVLGQISVNGEVNKDIISLFGDISVRQQAVARGDIVSLTGEIKVEKQASIYGEIYSGVKDYDSKRFRFYQESELSPGLMLNYNRVDGLLLGGNLGLVHNDSAYPSVKLGVGYAMESERLRFFVRASQLISRNKSFSIGGEYYKKLASEDDRIISDGENMAFVLTATEDYKDFYESEGSAGWLEMHPCLVSIVKVGYRYDDTHWLRAHRYMWSLFGGSKLFPENFGTVESSYRTLGIAEIEQTNNAVIFIESSYDSRNVNDGKNNSGWLFAGQLEWSHMDFSSDFDYRRYLLSVVRYQPINKYTSIRLRGEFAGSDGHLPMYKLFFLGGLGTLWGYKHKEFSGSRYWLANTEYWVNLPTNFESNLILFWDVARISGGAGFDDSDEIRHDIGLGIELSDISFNLAKRLDSAPDRNPRFYLRFSTTF